MAVALHDSHAAHTKKQQCTSASCCSPLRVWRKIQTMIHEDAKDEFARFAQSTPADLVTRVLLTSRVSNDPALYTPSQKSRIIQFPIAFRQEAVRKFGKSATDLNAVQLALLLHPSKRDGGMAMVLLQYLKQHATPNELQVFVNHVWGQRNTTLHLACFWNMPRLVRLLLDLGADATIRNARQVGPADCCTSDECLALLSSTITHRQKTTTATTKVPKKHQQSQQQPQQLQQPSPLKRPSMLLKKASERSSPIPASPSPVSAAPTLLSTSPIPAEYFTDKKPVVDHLLPASPAPTPIDDEEAKDNSRAANNMSPMSFSSSSSSSSFSSMSSIEETMCWTPPPSPMASPPVAPAATFDDAAATDAPEWMTADEPPVPERPSCRPQIKSPSPPPPARQVRFDPRVILVDACIRGDLTELKTMVQELGCELRMGIGGVQNRSLLHIALLHGHDQVARYLVEHVKVDVNHPDNDGTETNPFNTYLRWLF